MDSDLYLTIGVILGALSIPSLLSAYSEGRPPRAGSVLVLAAGALVAAALWNKPDGYAVEDIPQAIFRVIGRFVN